MVDTAIVGFGWWGQVLVASARERSEHIRFVRAVTRNPEHAKAAEALGLAVGGSLEDALSAPGIAAVVLATPHSVHVEQVIMAAAAGRHVFCEKPLALTSSEARRAVDACRDAEVVLGLGTDKRFLPAVAELRAMVDDGRLGTLLHVEGQYSNPNSALGISGDWRSSPDETPGAGLSGPGLHALDAMTAMAGPLAEVDARVQTFEAGFDSISARLRFASGVSGLLAAVRAVPDYFRLSAFGTRGWGEVHGFGSLTTSLGEQGVVRQEHGARLMTGALLDAFAVAVEGGAPFPVAHDEMLITVAAFEALIDSVQEQRTIRLAT